MEWAYRASGQVSDDLIERLQGHKEIRNTHPGKERQIQDGACGVISPEQNPSYNPEQGICEEFESHEEE